MTNSIFDVDVKGLRQLQEGKPKWFIVRELLQNALDEDITKCDIYFSYTRGKATITVDDDSPIGFRDLADAYTLFKDTYKRSNAQKRGRFNLGEKQVICLADWAKIVTTTGTIEFDLLKGTRTRYKTKTEIGSSVMVVVRMTREEYEECITFANDILVPENFKVSVCVDERQTLEYKKPHKSFTAKLLTEIKVDDRMRNVSRETVVNLHILPVSYIFEMGIPICEIDCNYSIDVQQKVPMSNDRDKVDAKYLKNLYGEVLNHTAVELDKENISNTWVREGFASDRSNPDAQKVVIEKRFGDKALIANPNDRRSMDEAISNNYNVIYGSEMNKEEWSKVKANELLVSTSAMFKTGVAQGRFLKTAELSTEQLGVAVLSKKIAKEILGISIEVHFYDSPNATVKADYGSNVLRFNVAHFQETEWTFTVRGTVKTEMLDLIIHELGHSAGWHYEHSYHECITKLGAELTMKALADPKWFKVI